MKKEWGRIVILALIVAALMPWTVLRWIDQTGDKNDFQIRVLMPDGTVKKLWLEDYLVGVVAGEMPAKFNSEALKAQAVAARTYAAKRLSTAKQSQDQGYDVDTTEKTQVWLSDSQMRQKWGWTGYFRYESKIKSAVEATRGQVLVSEGQYIDAYYYSSSGRKETERSEDVWSASRPYLQNVASGEKEPLRFVKKYTFTAQELYQKLGLAGTPKALTGSDFQILTRTSAGRAETVSLLGKTYQATQLRTLFGLASTDIECAVSDQKMVFTTYGSGHGVGMSQYGANDMAGDGAGYKDILAHFYPGTTILALKQGN